MQKKEGKRGENLEKRILLCTTAAHYALASHSSKGRIQGQPGIRAKLFTARTVSSIQFQPKDEPIALRPPGGARTRVVERSEMKLPLFWLPLEAQALEDTAPLLTVLVVVVVAAIFDDVFSETGREVLLVW